MAQGGHFEVNDAGEGKKTPGDGRVPASRLDLVRLQAVGVEAGLVVYLQHLAAQGRFVRSCSFIAPWLHEQVKNLTFVVDRAPEPGLLPRDYHGHLIEMPPRSWPRASTAK